MCEEPGDKLASNPAHMLVLSSLLQLVRFREDQKQAQQPQSLNVPVERKVEKQVTQTTQQGQQGNCEQQLSQQCCNLPRQAILSTFAEGMLHSQCCMQGP